MDRSECLSKMLVLVHGGAGDIPDCRVPAKIDGVCRATKEGYSVLKSGKSVLDAVQAAVNIMEDDPAFNAGHGSVLNADGEVEMDAIIMEGGSLKAGAVGAIKNVAHPVDVARLVMERTPHCLLVGAGAKKFASDCGVPDVPVDSLVTDFARSTLSENKTTSELGELSTVGAVAVDEEGNVACATSTGGISGKMVGRVGDTPLPGCGGYADNSIGAVSTTGFGESIMRFCLAHRIIVALEEGKLPQEAVADCCQKMSMRVGQTAGAIAVTPSGIPGMAFTSNRMAWAYKQGRTLHYGIEQGEHHEVDD